MNIMLSAKPLSAFFAPDDSAASVSVVQTAAQTALPESRKRIFLVTGAAGHLGNVMVRQLTGMGEQVRCLVLPNEVNAPQLPKTAQIFGGNVTIPASMEGFFTLPPDTDGYVIHAAGIVSIASKFQPLVEQVNVDGTRNVINLCLTHGIRKLVYVSSVHALPVLPKGQVITEVPDFDPALVQGLYAKTKAAASHLVLQAVREQGLDASIVHPSGLCGPEDYGRGHLTQLLVDFLCGRLTAGVRGGFDFADVRDVASGVINCALVGEKGACYLLTNRYFPLEEVFDIFHRETGHKPIRTMLPTWFAKATAPLAEGWYKMLKQPPLFTSYSLYTLSCNADFSHKKADTLLQYHTRPFGETVRDTAAFLVGQHRVPTP